MKRKLTVLLALSIQLSLLPQCYDGIPMLAWG